MPSCLSPRVGPSSRRPPRKLPDIDDYHIHYVSKCYFFVRQTKIYGPDVHHVYPARQGEIVRRATCRDHFPPADQVVDAPSPSPAMARPPPRRRRLLFPLLTLACSWQVQLQLLAFLSSEALARCLFLRHPVETTDCSLIEPISPLERLFNARPFSASYWSNKTTITRRFNCFHKRRPSAAEALQRQ